MVIMVFSKEDLILIKSLYLSKGYGFHKLMLEFLHKGWKRRSLDKLLRKIHNSGQLSDRKVAEHHDLCAQLRTLMPLMTLY